MTSRFKYRAVYNTNQFGGPNEDASYRGLGYVPAYHKRQWGDCPYRIPNEYICNKLGDFIGLPMPPCALTASDIPHSKTTFTLLDFNVDRDNLPPIDGDACFEHLPELSTGVVVFDIWVANEDRHDTNLVVDSPRTPSVMQVFDHDQALFGGFLATGEQRLNKLLSRLGITGSTTTGGNRHCLLDAIKSPDYIPAWVSRIQQIPTYVIERLCNEMKKKGLITLDEEKGVVEFLVCRRSCLDGMIKANQHEFTGITSWPRTL